MKILEGRPLAPGIAFGRLRLLRTSRPEVLRRHAENCAHEIARAEDAFSQAIEELQAICERSHGSGNTDCAEIFDAHRMLLSDADFMAQIRSIILSEHADAAYAAAVTGESFSELLRRTNDPYLRERAEDIRDISDRLVRILTEEESGRDEAEFGRSFHEKETEKRKAEGEKEQEGALKNTQASYVLAAKSFSPSETVQLDKSAVCAFVTEEGAANSHTAIIARIMGIPAVSGIKMAELLACEKASEDQKGAATENAEVLETADAAGYKANCVAAPDDAAEIPVIADGTNGKLILFPDAKTCSAYRKAAEAEEERKKLLLRLRGLPARTRSGQRVRLYANVGSLDDFQAAFDNDAEGIGLFRTEFLYLGRESAPTEEEQFQIYRRAAEMTKGKRLVIRTLDLGADKQPRYFAPAAEENPALGLRGIRFGICHPALFKAQLRAVLRAGGYGSLELLYPLVSSLSELHEAKRILEEAKKELCAEGIPFDQSLRQGVMLETPAAALTADLLAREADFFSIGTNDLTQYTLALDRGSAVLERFCDARHEALIRLLQMSAEAARAQGKPIGICGELAADTEMTPLFLKLGIRSLSVAPAAILPLRQRIREMP